MLFDFLANCLGCVKTSFTEPWSSIVTNVHFFTSTHFHLISHIYWYFRWWVVDLSGKCFCRFNLHFKFIERDEKQQLCCKFFLKLDISQFTLIFHLSFLESFLLFKNHGICGNTQMFKVYYSNIFVNGRFTFLTHKPFLCWGRSVLCFDNFFSYFQYDFLFLHLADFLPC